jgi:hypothetical protein
MMRHGMEARQAETPLRLRAQHDSPALKGDAPTGPSVAGPPRNFTSMRGTAFRVAWRVPFFRIYF